MDYQTAELEFGLGRALGSQDKCEPAIACITRAFDYFEECNDVERAVAVAAYLFFPTFTSDKTRDKTIHLLERAMKIVASDSHEAGILLEKIGFIKHNPSGEYSQAVDAFRRALEISRRENDKSLELKILYHW